MPFTPYHLGPGLVAKSVAPARLSLSAFMATSVLVDVETAYYIYRNEWPLHRGVHSLAGCVAVGLAVAMIGYATRPLARKIIANFIKDFGLSGWCPQPWIDAELSFSGLLAGGLAGGVTASLLDALVHSDIMPFWPMSTSNPFHQWLGWGVVNIGCVLVGVTAAVVLAVRARRLRQG